MCILFHLETFLGGPFLLDTSKICLIYWIYLPRWIYHDLSRSEHVATQYHGTLGKFLTLTNIFHQPTPRWQHHTSQWIKDRPLRHCQTVGGLRGNKWTEERIEFCSQIVPYMPHLWTRQSAGHMIRWMMTMTCATSSDQFGKILGPRDTLWEAETKYHNILCSPWFWWTSFENIYMHTWGAHTMFPTQNAI